MFSAVNSGQARQKMISGLPTDNNMMTLEQYNEYFKHMMKVQTDTSGNSLPQKEELEKNHRSIVSACIQSVISQKKNDRKKK
jgi:gamma-glutamyl:cysteine ligase YbdK (ATP-grasp superfamily)